ADASQSPEFSFGYAQAADGAPLYPDAAAEAVATLSGGVVLAVDRDAASDRLLAVFASSGTIVEGWVDARSLRPMSRDEIDAFQNGITEALCYQDNVEYPLAEHVVTPLVSASAAPQPEEPSVENS